jgi:transposase-like protein
MKTSEKDRLIKSISTVDNRFFSLIKEAVEKREDIKFVAKLLNNQSEDIKCPHCRSLNLQKWGIRNDMQRYKCKECKRTFNALTGTPLAKLRKKGRWLEYAQCLKDGLSIRKAAKKCGVHKNTSFRWRHRFLANSTKIKPDRLNGIIEVDELFFAKSEKGNKKINRKPRKRGYKSKNTIPVKERVFTLFCRDRSKNSYDNIVSVFNTKSIKPLIDKLISRDSLLCSQDKQIYLKYSKQSNIRHGKLSISNNDIVNKNIVHIQNVRLYQKKLQIWMIRFHGVATKYLNNYLSWFREIDEFDFKITPETILIRAMRAQRYNTNHYR